MDAVPFAVHDSSHYVDTYRDSLMAHYPGVDRISPSHAYSVGVNATALPASFDFRKVTTTIDRRGVYVCVNSLYRNTSTANRPPRSLTKASAAGVGACLWRVP